MNPLFSPRTSLAIVASLSLFTFQSHADIAITAEAVDGDVVFSLSGSIRTAELANPQSELRSGAIAPKNSLVQFATTSGSESLSGFGSSVASAPANFGLGSTALASSQTGDKFSVTKTTVAFASGYQSGNPLSGTISFTGETLASLEINASGSPYVWSLTNGETITLTVESSALRTSILQKIKKLTRKLKAAKKKKKKAKVKNLRKQIKLLRGRL